MQKQTFHPASYLLILLAACLPYCKSPGGGAQAGPRQREMCQTGRISVWGEAPVFSSVAAARQKAKAEACRTAVEKCIGQEVASTTGVADGQSIVNEIFTQARGMCKEASLIQEDTYKLDTVTMLRAFYRFEVTAAYLRDTIQLLQKLVGNPKVMVLIRETYKLPKKRIEGFTSSNSLSAKLLRDFLASKGYSIIAPAAIKTLIKNEKTLIESPEKLDAELRDAALQAGADVLVIGQVEALPQRLETLEGTGLQSFRATGSISLLSLWGSGAVLGEYTQSQPGAQVTAYAAARSAITKFARGKESSKTGGMLDFVDKRLQKEWANITRNNKIAMYAEGLAGKSAAVFRDNLQERSAVKSINERERSQAGVKWELSYPGRVFALADTISFYSNNPKVFSVLQKPGCGPIEILGVKRGFIHLRFGPKCK